MDIKRYINILLAIIVTLCALSVSVDTSFADELAFTQNPEVIYEKAMKNPSGLETHITLTNRSDMTEMVNFSLRPFTSSALHNGTISSMSQANIPSDYTVLFSHIQILDANKQIEQLTLGPKQTKNISIIINIDPSLQKKDYYFSLISLVNAVQQTTENPEKDTNSASASSTLTLGTASNILLSIEPKDSDITLKKFAISFWQIDQSVPFQIAIANKGNNFIRVKGTVTINNILGQKIRTIAFPDTTILANNYRLLSDQAVISSLIPGFYTGSLRIQKAHNEANQLDAQTSFVVLPIWSSLYIVVILFFVFLVHKRISQK